MLRVKIAAIILALLLLTSCTANNAAVDIPIDGTLSATVTPIASEPTEMTDDGYFLAASNDNYSLYYEKTGLTVKVVNNHTGSVMDSAAPVNEDFSDVWKNFVNSGIVLEYFKGEAVNINKANMYSGKPETKISIIKDGFAAELSFKSIGISLTAFFTLNDDGIRVQIPYSSIKETDKQFKLAAIYVLPFLGYTAADEVDGYMLIPDGSGATIALNNNNERFSQPYKAKVYGGNYSVEANTAVVQKYDDSISTMVDAAGVFAPIFGMVHTSRQNAVLGIIESGNHNAEIYAYPNGVITEFNWITARYVYREVYQYLTGQSGSIISTQEKPETFDISVVYRFKDGEDADYAGLAKSYREYLLENELINTDADVSYSTRLDFFAGDQEEALVGRKFVAMTTVDQMEKILSELKDKGVDSLSVSLKGWQKDGIYGKIEGKTSFEGKIGSIGDYAKLASKYSDIADFMLYGDFLNVYASSGSKEYIYQYNGRVFSDETQLDLHPTKYRYTAAKAAEYVEKFIKAVQKKDNIGISFDGITNEVYSYGSGQKRAMFSRQYAAGLHTAAMKKASENMTTAYTSPNDYTWKDLQKYYDFRIYGSGYKFAANEVPFFAIALQGSVPLYSEYVNFKADSTEYKLKLIESGVYPSFLLTYESASDLIYTDSSSIFSCEYKEYKDMIIEYNEIFTELSEATAGSKISDHTSQDGINAMTYENGTVVVVNYNDTDAEYNGNTVAAQSYLILSGKAVQ